LQWSALFAFLLSLLRFRLSLLLFPFSFFFLAFLLWPGARAQGPSLEGNSLPEVLEAIECARVVTRILYVTAHPDDEPGGVLVYLARGLHADVALLSLTRGEGGQNALGPEQAPQLGVIRTEELLRATKVYGTRLYFTRAADFGYTKSANEALHVWGEPVLRDIVHVIRAFRPHIVINNWHGVRSGHGQHQASGILTPQAVEAAADEKRFPDAGPAWKVTRTLALSRGGSPAARSLEIPMNEVSPLWGKTWGEMGIEGYLNHRSQGVAGIRNSPFFRGSRALYVVSGDDPPPMRSGEGGTLANLGIPGVLSGIGFRPELENADAAIGQAIEALRRMNWAKSARDLVAAARLVRTIQEKSGSAHPPHVRQAVDELQFVRERIDRALALASGLRISAHADRSEIVAGESLSVRAAWQKRGDVTLQTGKVELVLPYGWRVAKEEAGRDGEMRFTLTVPADAKAPEHNDSWKNPWPTGLVRARICATLDGYSFYAEEEVNALQITSTGATTRPPVLVPAVALTLEPKSFVIVSSQAQAGGPAPRPLELFVRVRHYSTAKEQISVGVETPPGWTAPAEQSVEFDGTGDQLVRFTIPRLQTATAGKYVLRAYAKRANGEVFRASLEPLPTLPSRLWKEPAEAKVHAMNLRVPAGLRVGYVAAENDPIPPALRQIGVQVELLDEVALAFGELANFDAICVGIRAYELRPDLIRANQRLLDYAAAGGTLVVQYQRDGVWNQLLPAPYPARMPQRDARVADETAAVRVLAPEHPVLNAPNKIREADFDGWVQERGLYFWGEWDARYTPLLAMKDPTDTEESCGSLLVAPHGKGVYIFTGLSFFRQLPEGVPGAYRLFVNLLSQSRQSR
jgi:LmbE family N-acetylglucosaminyl deacetylase